MDPVVQTVTNILSFGTVVSDLLILFLLIVILTPLSERGWGKRVASFFGDHAILLTFLISAGSVVASLFYSEYAGYIPCELCWIERALIYPQALITAIALIALKFNRSTSARGKIGEFTRRACLILAGIDFPISAYHTYLQLGGNALAPCSATGPDCAFVYFVQYGYVTIPSMALTAATLILLFMLFKQPANIDNK